MTDAQRARWQEITTAFRVRNAGEEAGDRIAAQLADLRRELAELGERAITAVAAGNGEAPSTGDHDAHRAIHRLADALDRLDAAWGLTAGVPIRPGRPRAAEDDGPA